MCPALSLRTPEVRGTEWDFDRCFADAGRPGAPCPQKLWNEHVHAFYRLLGRLCAVLLHHGLRTGLKGDLDAGVYRFRRVRP